MFSRNELIEAIEELEDNTATFQNCQKLATFYLLYDHLYGVNQLNGGSQISRITVIGDYGNSEFLESIAGQDAEKVFLIIDELMESVKLLQPRLFDATLTRIEEIR